MLLKVAMEEQTERHGKLGWEWQKYTYNVEELDQGAVTLEVDLVVGAWAMHFGFP